MVLIGDGAHRGCVLGGDGRIKRETLFPRQRSAPQQPLRRLFGAYPRERVVRCEDG